MRMLDIGEIHQSLLYYYDYYWFHYHNHYY